MWVLLHDYVRNYCQTFSDFPCDVLWNNFRIFSAKFSQKSTAIFPEISGKIPKEISGNFLTHIPTDSVDKN